MFTKEQGRPLGKDGPKVTDATNAVDASTIADPGDGVPDLAAWRCRTGRCIDRPAHDRLDWWPAWALETRWPA